jgi:hypothetical protein
LIKHDFCPQELLRTNRKVRNFRGWDRKEKKKQEQGGRQAYQMKRGGRAGLETGAMCILSLVWQHLYHQVPGDKSYYRIHSVKCLCPTVQLSFSFIFYPGPY